MELTALYDGVPTDCVVNFDNIHTLDRRALRRRDTVLVLTADVAYFEALRAQAANGRRIAIRRP